jgi:S1-C subfamily serine protease
LISAIKGRTIIELIKKENIPLGLTISGGIDKDGKPKVAQLKQGSLAQKADVLEIGDLLLGINGIKTAGLKHEQVIDLIKQVGDQLTLEIEYDLPKWRMYNHKSFFLSFHKVFYSYIIIYSCTCN